MKRSGAALVAAFLLAAPCGLVGAENLVIKPGLDYSDHNKKQGPLITGDHMDEGLLEGMPNYIFFYMEKCYNAKRQALITVHMYEKYKGRVHFVVVNLDKPMSQAQKTRKEIRKLELGEVLRVVTTVRGSVAEFQGWAKVAKNVELIGQETESRR